eukprot:18318-Heterococcus_DN1.PRE.2
MDSRTVGVLGGGQLGRMMAEAAHRLGIKLIPLDPEGKASPAGQVAELAVEGSFRDAEKIHMAATECSRTYAFSQQASASLCSYMLNNIAVGEFADTPTEAAVIAVGAQFGYPLMLKAKKMAYDGKGNAVVNSEADVAEAWQKLGGAELYAEKWVPFKKELAVMYSTNVGDLLRCCSTVIMNASVYSHWLRSVRNFESTCENSTDHAA